MIIHSMEIGSNGKGAERYGVFLPFELQYNRTIQLEDSTNIDIGGVQLTLEKMRQQYAFYGGDFESKDYAASFLGNLQSSLLLYSLKRRVGIRYPKTISDLHLLPEASPVLESKEGHKMFRDQGWEVIHGSYEIEKAYVVPQHLCLARHATGLGPLHMSLSLGPSIELLESFFQETITFPDLPKLQDHSKLRLGIEMYALSHFEVSEEAKFLSLIASLEATLEPSRVSEASRLAIENAVGEIQSRMDQAESPEKENLQHLLQRVNGLVERSIEDKFINQIANRGNGLLGDLPKKLSSAYTTRSRLIQDGWVDQQQLQSDLFNMREFVPAYFENEYRHVTGAL